MRELVVVGVAVTCLGASRPARAGGALDKRPFTATAEELIAEARPFEKSDSEVVVLRDETALSFDDKGRGERRVRVVFVVTKQGGVDDWGTLVEEWRPFYQERPAVRARVVGRDGRIAELDASLITDAPAISESPSVFSDRRRLEAPLPRLAIGSIVEEEIVLHDREPLLRAGVIDGDSVGRAVPVQRTIITISAPASRKLHLAAIGFAKAPAPKQSTAGGRTTSTYDFGPTEPHQEKEAGIPSDQVSIPGIEVATAPTWEAVADEYRSLVEQRLAQGTFSAPDGLTGSTQRETITRAVAWLHQHVRYTGIELSDSAIVPWPPAETTKRGFGDCKDKATLLVALLRASGIRADLVLLDTGPGFDVRRDMPGMGWFDHAIVRAKADGRDVWIDATEDDLPVGQLPSRDQNRLALVIAPGTRDLVATPGSLPADNLVREVRTLHIAEHDRGTVTETSSGTGIYFSNQRGWYRDTRRDEIQKNLSRYAKQTYEGTLDSFSGTDPSDLTKPFELTLEVSDSPRAFTFRKRIEAHLFRSALLNNIPSALKEEEPKERKLDYVWFTPHVAEIEYRLVVPPGYSMPELTAHEQKNLGTMTLTTTRKVDRDTLVITYRLETGKVRLTPSEFLETRKAVRELQDNADERVTISRTAVVLAQQGKTKEAIADVERLIAMHPKEALHYDQLADIYRETGMGVAARRAARKAIEVEPKSADAHDLLAYQLRHDTLGREYGFDADRKAAIAEYRKAIDLDPKHLGALNDFATVLTVDEHGHLNTDLRERKEAIALWRRAKDIAHSDEYDSQIVMNLLLTGELADAESTARAMKESRIRSMYLVAAVAASRGAREAIALAASLASDRTSSKILEDAAGALVMMRRYDVARALFDETKTADTNPMQIAIYQSLSAIDVKKLDPADPKTPPLLLFAMLLQVPVPSTPWDPEVGKELTDQLAGLRDASAMKVWTAMPATVKLDLIAAMMKLTVEGSAATGWRVAGDVATSKVSFYVVQDHGRANLIGTVESAASIGALVQRLLAKGDLAGAARWIDWVAKDLALPHGTTPYDALPKIVGRGATPSRDALELAAAMLMAKHATKAAVATLRRCPGATDEIKKACRSALVTAFAEQHDWKELADVEKQELAADPTSLEALTVRANALVLAHELPTAVSELDAALAQRPDEVALLRIRSLVATAAGDAADATARFDKVLQHPAARALDFNNAAWAHLFFDPTPEHARELAARGERLETTLSQPFANTIAAIEAELDHPAAAWSYTRKSLAKLKDDNPTDDDWYVIGRIAESYGLRDDAIAAYHRVQPPKFSTTGQTGYVLAQKALKRLQAR